jgi:hypothetical protein
MNRHLIIILACLVAAFLTSCTPAQLAGLKTAGVIANGVACGIAAANETPCTPQAVLDALARDAAAQQVKVEAVAPQASAVDAAQTEALLSMLAANAEQNKRIAEALVSLAARSEPLPQYALPPLPPPPPKPTGEPMAPLPPPPTTLSPAPPKPTPLEMLRSPLGRVY